MQHSTETSKVCFSRLIKISNVNYSAQKTGNNIYGNSSNSLNCRGTGRLIKKTQLMTAATGNPNMAGIKKCLCEDQKWIYPIWGAKKEEKLNMKDFSVMTPCLLLSKETFWTCIGISILFTTNNNLYCKQCLKNTRDFLVYFLYIQCSY